MRALSALISRAGEIIAAALGPNGSALAWIPASNTKRGIYSYSRMSEPDQLRFCEFMAEYSLRVLGAVDRVGLKDFDILPVYRKLHFPPQLGAELLSRPHAKAKVVRPLVHDTLLREFGAEPRRHESEPGMWIFDSRVGDRSAQIELRYKNRGDGLEISFVNYNEPAPVLFADRLCCFGGGHWDMIFEGEELEQVAKIPRYIREAYQVCHDLRFLDGKA